MRILFLFLIFCFQGLLFAQYISEPEAIYIVNNPLPQPILNKTHALQLPFFEDFYNGIDSTKWINTSMCTVKNGVTNAAPNKGVLIFDGLDSTGLVYDNFRSKGTSDRAQSQKIDLSVYLPSDSVFFSFYFSHGQLADPAEDKDSLFLYFLNNSGTYDKVWIRPGGDTINGMVQIMLPITNPDYFHSGFEFLFQSYGSRNGLFDVFMIDYIYINSNRSLSDTTYQDISFAKESNMRMGLFSALPWKHLNSTQTWPSFEIPVHSLQANNTQRLLGAQLEEINRGQLLTGTTFYSQFYSFPRNLTNYPLPAFSSQNLDSTSLLKSTFTLSPDASDLRPQNDTLIQYFRCDSILAYDDGEAETYIGRPLSSLYLQQYVLPKSDSLRAVWMQFISYYNIPDGKGFELHYGPSLDNLTYQFCNLNVTKDQKSFQRIKLDSLAYIEDTFYVGIKNSTNADEFILGLGFDRNTNNQLRIFEDSSRVWLTSPFEGTMMIRLELTDGAAPTVSREDKFKSIFSCYPNPSNGKFFIQGHEVQWIVKDIQGKVVPFEQANNQLFVNQGIPGMYFLETIWNNELFVHKIVVQP